MSTVQVKRLPIVGEGCLLPNTFKHLRAQAQLGQAYSIYSTIFTTYL